MERHAENAMKIAKFLEHHPAVESVSYPWLESHPQYDMAKKQQTSGGGIISFELKGDLQPEKR
jgi:cystathionine beta-lyase/cystathionine gamma-synthase